MTVHEFALIVLVDVNILTLEDACTVAKIIFPACAVQLQCVVSRVVTKKPACSLTMISSYNSCYRPRKRSHLTYHPRYIA